MATASEQVKLLSGTKEDQNQLYSSLISRLSDGEILLEYELIFLEALKKIFTAEMSATATGSGSLR
jgi:Tfp pilus assembly protein PilZ